MKMLILSRSAAGCWMRQRFLRHPMPSGVFIGLSGFENWNGLQSPITAVMGAAPDHKGSPSSCFPHTIKSPAPSCVRCEHALDFQRALQPRHEPRQPRQYIEALDVEIFPDYVFCGPPRDGSVGRAASFSASWKVS